MTFVEVASTVLIGVLAGGLSVLAGGGVTVVLPVLLALGLTADQANATSRLNLTVGAVIATIVLIRKKKIEWTATVPLLVATVAGAIVGAFAGTFIHSNAMLTIIVLTSVVSMILVYIKPNRWLSTAPTSPVVPDRARGRVHLWPALLLRRRDRRGQRDPAPDRVGAADGIAAEQGQSIKVVTGLALFALSSAIYGDAGKVDWPVAAWLAAGTAVGSYAASGFAASDTARKWVYLVLQVSVTLETALLLARWLGWVPSP
jgi:uncharacterized membrane protein YfcA